jgi:hypothetical protein
VGTLTIGLAQVGIASNLKMANENFIFRQLLINSHIKITFYDEQNILLILKKEVWLIKQKTLSHYKCPQF